ncbi:MAG: class I SAM-dependent RNA methyltransferase [Deltaproteobacteria bacterium]|nr:class I SAM-dependent RNA methyltransferase [Deltaproteobacteria bacterium]
MGQLAAEELAELKARNIHPGYRGLHFEADPASLYRINYGSRYLTRVLAPLITFHCHTHDYLYRRAKQVEWSDFFTPEHSFAVFANVSNSRIHHSHFAALRLKDAVADYFREKFDRRPAVQKGDPDVWINLYVENNRATLSMDTSGGSLHRRGYRVETLPAVMQETLAAAVLRLTSWDGSSPLYDPMCGSGTFLCEALMLYCRLPSAFLRKRFGFEFLPDYDPLLWNDVKEEADRAIRPLPRGLIAGSDLSQRAVGVSRVNLGRLPQGSGVEVITRDFRKLPGLQNTTIVCDPPYGIRLRGKEDPEGLYRAFGDFLKRRCKGSAAFIYFGNREFIPFVGLKPSWKVPLSAGGLDGRLVKYELY